MLHELLGVQFWLHNFCCAAGSVRAKPWADVRRSCARQGASTSADVTWRDFSAFSMQMDVNQLVNMEFSKGFWSWFGIKQPVTVRFGMVDNGGNNDFFYKVCMVRMLSTNVACSQCFVAP